MSHNLILFKLNCDIKVSSMVVSGSCLNLVAGSALEAACNCALAADAVSTTLAQYTLRIEKYAIDFASFQRYELAKEKYDNLYSLERNRISSETTSGTCAGAGICGNSNCDQSGWVESGSTYKCNVGGQPTGCAKNCIRGQEFVNSLMDVWKKNNPGPVMVSRPEQPNATINANILCCSQYIGGINANTSNISNINQNCKQEINDRISGLKSPVVPVVDPVVPPVDTTVHPDDTIVPPTDSTTTTLLLILLAVLIIGAVVFVLI